MKTLAEATALLTKDADAVAIAKGRDYREGSADLLANFRQAAADAGITPLQVWLVFFNKHRAAIANYIKTNGESQSEPIHGRFVDALNYIRLGWLLMVEAELERAPADDDLEDVGAVKLPASVTHFPGLGAEVETRDSPEHPWIRSKFHKLFDGDEDHMRDYGVSIRIEGRSEIYSSKDRHGEWLWRPIPTDKPLPAQPLPMASTPAEVAQVTEEWKKEAAQEAEGRELTPEEKQRRNLGYGKFATSSPGDEIEIKDDDSSDNWKKVKLLRYSEVNRDLYPEDEYGYFVFVDMGDGSESREPYTERDPDGNMLWRRIPSVPVPEIK